MFHHITRATRHLIFWSLIAVALVLTGVRLSLAVIENYKTELQRQIGVIIDAPVRIGTLKARMHGLTPTLILKGINVGTTDTDEAAVKLDEIRLNVSLREIFLKQSLWNASWITLVGAELAVTKREDGSFDIVGLKGGGQYRHPLWLLRGSKFELLRSRVTWRNEHGNAKPLKFEQVDLVIKNDAAAHRHQLHALLKLPADYGDRLRVSMVLEGNFFEPAGITGKMFFEGQRIDLAKLLNGELPGLGEFGAGRGSFKLWTDWRKSLLTGMTGQAELQGLSFSTGSGGAFSADSLAGWFNWQRGDRHWQLDVSDLAMTTRARRWQPVHFSVRGERIADGRLGKLALAAARLDLRQAAQLALSTGLLPERQAHLLDRLQLSGVLQDMTLFADLPSNRFALAGRLQTVGFAGFDGVPGVAGLSGRVQGGDEAGWLQLQSGGVKLAAGKLFRRALTLERLHGRIDWRQTLDDWRIATDSMVLDVADMHTVSRANWVLPKNDDGSFLDLQTGFSLANVARLTDYLPVKLMNPETVAWLDRALISGRIVNGGLLVHGDPAQLPFDQGQGVLETLFDVEQLAVAYNPDWPEITGLTGKVRIRSDGLAVDVDRAAVLQCPIRQAAISIPSLARSHYAKIRGRSDCDIRNILEFLRQSPLQTSVAGVTEAVAAAGTASVELALETPLVAALPGSTEGRAVLHDVQLSIDAVGFAVTQLNGTLQFNDQGLFAEALSASALGYPVSIKVERQPELTVVEALGRAGIDSLKKQFRLPDFSIASGVLDFRVQYRMPHDPNRSGKLSIDTDLQGVALNLPEALAKTVAQKKPLSVAFALGREPLLPVDLNYDDLLKAAFVVDGKRSALKSGTFVYGNGQAVDDGKTIKLTVRREQIRLETWLDWYRKLGEGAAFVTPDQVEIHTERLTDQDRELGALDWMLKRSPSGWMGTIKSPLAEGLIHIPFDLNGDKKLRLALQYLDCSLLDRLDLQGWHRPTGVLPLWDISSEKMLWRSVDLGRFELESERIANGLAFNRIELLGPKWKLMLTGTWTVSHDQAMTRLGGGFSSEQFGDFLKRLGLYDNLKETRANADFDLSWPGAPYRFEFGKLDGHADIELRDGRLLSIEPGLGRVLGILAFAQWGKRILLDFRDVYKQGLSFNSIKGRIDFAHGIAHTDNLVVNAVPAKISLVGDANLIDRTLDQWVTVVPKSSDALPIAGTIVGKIAGMVASVIAENYKEGYFFGSEYRIKGSWQSPEVIPLHENDGLFQKTWQGITDFPWLDDRQTQ